MNRAEETASHEVPGTSSACEVWVGDELEHAERDEVIEEVPVALVYNGISHAVMLASPADLEDFALGFSLTEGIVAGIGDVHDVDVVAGADGVEVHLTIAGACMAALKERRRALTGRTGCGLCGVETLRDAVRPVRVVGSPDGAMRPIVDRKAIALAFRHLGDAQHLHRATGAAHAAAFARPHGEVVLSREDVGRHNALDKLIGAMARPRPGAAIDPADGFIVVTSRASYEMVHKTAAAGVPLLAALAAPTALAIRVARQAGLTLIGSAGRDLRIFSHPTRLTPASRT